MLSITLPNYAAAPTGGWRGLVDLAKAAEDAGVGRVVVVDHVVMGRDTSAYPTGPFPGTPEMPWLEPLTVLGAIAGATSRIRLATGIVIPALRGAAVFAKTAATLDQMSGGRLELGVGTGWQRAEYDAAGLPWEARGRLLTDLMGACRTLWRDSPASYESETVSFGEVWCEPRPVRPEGIPLLASGTTHARNVDRIVRFGDGWIPIMGETVEGVARGAELLRGAFADAGRDPATLRVQGSLPIVRDASGRPDLAGSLAAVPALHAAGATTVNVNFSAFCPDPADAPAVLEQLVAGYAAT